MTTQLQTRLRSTGTFPPSLLREGVQEPPDGFEDAVVEVLDGNGAGGGLALRADTTAADDFDALLKMTETAYSSVAPLSPEQQQHVLERRRAILLAIMGATPPSNAPLNEILVNGFLVVAKSWLDDILSKTVGGVDLLLHMLSSISSLPVTKDMIATSKLGKAIVSVEKDKICSGSDNEVAIKERVAKVKEEWSQTVKKRKGETDSLNSPTSTKRAREASSSSSPAKKAKAEEKKHIMSTSDLLRKSGATNDKAVLGEDGRPLSAAEAARKRAQERHAKERARIASIGNGTEQKESQSPQKSISAPGGSSKKTKHVAFAEQPVVFDAPYAEEAGSDASGEKKDAMSWSDRKKQEHLLEREALAKARKADMVKKDITGTVVAWKRPATLAVKPDQLKVVSNEIAVQVARMATVRSARYLSEEDVPNDPTPLSDIEQALEMTSQSSAVQATIPFYVPQQEAPVPAPAAATIPLPTPVATPIAQVVPPPPPIVGGIIQGATLEFVTALGLPPFLVGSNVQALQTVATTPGLLQTFIDAQGRYDQTRLMSLVQTLSQSLAPTQQSFVAQPNPVVNQATAVNSTMGGSGGFQHGGAVPPPPPFQQTQTQQSLYGATTPSSTYGSARSPQNRQQFGKGGGYRGDQNLTEGNLHLSGYGPSTTKEEILALFAPYVQVSEIVPKGSFSFVNTNDPAGARRAREALTGALLGGRPVRINLATRKDRDQKPGIKAKTVNRGEVMLPLPVNAFGQLDIEQVRDDRGNGATKNLFVAGYGQGTTEQELRDIFQQHGQVTGTVMKGSFAFVNTTDRETAVRARQSLTGAVVNGGVLRINFAKESGRLGTSFDQTYNPTSYGPIHQQRVFM